MKKWSTERLRGLDIKAIVSTSLSGLRCSSSSSSYDDDDEEDENKNGQRRDSRIDLFATALDRQGIHAVCVFSPRLITRPIERLYMVLTMYEAGVHRLRSEQH